MRALNATVPGETLWLAQTKKPGPRPGFPRLPSVSQISLVPWTCRKKADLGLPALAHNKNKCRPWL